MSLAGPNNKQRGPCSSLFLCFFPRPLSRPRPFRPKNSAELICSAVGFRGKEGFMHAGKSVSRSDTCVHFPSTNALHGKYHAVVYARVCFRQTHELGFRVRCLLFIELSRSPPGNESRTETGVDCFFRTRFGRYFCRLFLRALMFSTVRREQENNESSMLFAAAVVVVVLHPALVLTHLSQQHICCLRGWMRTSGEARICWRCIG